MKVKASELKDKSVSELKSELTKALRAQFKLRLASPEDLTKTHVIREARRSIARIQTVLAQKEGKNDE